jgi:SAM-dependent methyltransferase
MVTRFKGIWGELWSGYFFVCFAAVRSAKSCRLMVYNRAMNEVRNVLAEWRESAPYWEKHAATVRQLFAPISASLIRIAQIHAGQRVLDIGGGTGEPSLEIAGIVTPKGYVVCTDAVAEMVEAAERLAHQRAIDNVEFKQCAAHSRPSMMTHSTRWCHGSARCSLKICARHSARCSAS